MRSNRQGSAGGPPSVHLRLETESPAAANRKALGSAAGPRGPACVDFLATICGWAVDPLHSGPAPTRFHAAEAGGAPAALAPTPAVTPDTQSTAASRGIGGAWTAATA